MILRACFAFALLFSLVSIFPDGRASADGSIYVDSATEGWTTSGIVLGGGETATITATGAALCNALIQDICVTGPGGAQPAWETFVLPGAPAYSLIATIGGSGPFFVGSGPVQVTGPGELLLQYNDEYYPDNIGGYTVEISITQGGGDQGGGDEGGGDDGGDQGGDDQGGDDEEPHQPSVYSVVVLSPINQDGSSIFKANRGNIPVKFMVLKDGVEWCDLPEATIGVTRVAGENVGPISPDVFSSSSDSGTVYRITNGGCQYHYNLRARNLGPGSYEVAVYIDDVKVGGTIFTLE